jgi:acid phosphatase type 7
MRAPTCRILAAAIAIAACKSNGGSSSGATGDDAGAIPFSFAPPGCAYTIAPPDVRAFFDMAVDDASPFADPAGAAPVRVRLGLGGSTTAGAPGYADPTTTMAFVWETAASTRAAKVRLGTTPGALTDVHAGFSFSVPPPTIGFGHDEPPARLHEAHVCGLSPGTTYYYQVGGGPPGAEVWSAAQQFTTVPSAGPITLGISGDSRDSMDILQTVQQRMRDAAVTMQIFGGDLVFFGTQQSQYTSWLDKAWKDDKGVLTLGQQLIVPAAGNHEVESPQFFGAFALPGDGPYAESFGSFDVGSAHVVLLDDEAIATMGDTDEAKAQLAWLDADLARADQNRAARPFVVVDHHRGEYATAEHGGDPDVTAVREALVPIWQRHHVDLVLTGHAHEYERTKAVTGSPDAPTLDPAGTTYVICAGAGANAEAIGTAPVAHRAINVAYGRGTPYVGVYGLLTLDAKTLTFKALGLKVSGADDTLDTFTLTR